MVLDRTRLARAAPYLAAVPEVVKGDPREPLRLVVELRGHVEEDAQLRARAQRLPQKDSLLPAALPRLASTRLQTELQEVGHDGEEGAPFIRVTKDRQLARPREAQCGPRECESIVRP